MERLVLATMIVTLCAAIALTFARAQADAPDAPAMLIEQHGNSCVYRLETGETFVQPPRPNGRCAFIVWVTRA